MAGKDRYGIVPFTNPNGNVVHRVLGRTPDGKQVRENFKSFAEAVARKQALELEALGIQQSVSLKTTRLTDEELAQAESAFKKLQGTGHTLQYAIDWLLLHWRPPSTSPTVEAGYEKFIKEKMPDENGALTGPTGEVRLPAKTVTERLLATGGLLFSVCAVAYSYWKKCQPMEMVERARKEGRPICHCTQTGVVMTVLPQPQSGVGMKLYVCPRCNDSALAVREISRV